MGRIDKEQEKILVKQLYAKALNTLRTQKQDYFTLEELDLELPTVAKVKKRYISSKLINSGVIIQAGKSAFGKLYWFKDSKIPVSVSDLEIPITEGLKTYHSSVKSWNVNYMNKLKGKDTTATTSKEDKENKENSDSFEDECVKYLLSTGKYKIYKSHTEWEEINKD